MIAALIAEYDAVRSDKSESHLGRAVVARRAPGLQFPSGAYGGRAPVLREARPGGRPVKQPAPGEPLLFQSGALAKID